MAVDQWLPGPRKKLKAREKVEGKVSGRVLLVLDVSLFFKRDAKGVLTDKVSESMLREALSKYSRVVVVPGYGYARTPIFKEALLEFKLQVDMVDHDGAATDVTLADLLKRKLISLGVEIKHHSNPREISHLNIEKFILSDHIIVARKNDWERVGLTLDKPESFEDLSKKRKVRSFWK